MKLFQIEEPDGAAVDPDAPGVAVGIDLSGVQAEVAVAVGGNALVLHDRDGFERDLPVPLANGPNGAWQLLLEGAKLRAERALGQPVTHAVMVVAVGPEPGVATQLLTAAEAAGLTLLRIVSRDTLRSESDPAELPVLAAAILAEDLAPRPTAN